MFDYKNRAKSGKQRLADFVGVSKERLTDFARTNKLF